jgi:hypothetical protein
MNEHPPHTPSSLNRKHRKKKNLFWQYTSRILLDIWTTMLKIFFITLPTCLTRICLTNHHSSIFLPHQEQNSSTNKHEPSTSHMKIWQPNKSHLTIHQHCHCRWNLQNVNTTNKLCFKRTPNSFYCSFHLILIMTKQKKWHFWFLHPSSINISFEVTLTHVV